MGNVVRSGQLGINSDSDKTRLAGIHSPFGGEWAQTVVRSRIAWELLSSNTSLMRVDSASKSGLRMGPEGCSDWRDMCIHCAHLLGLPASCICAVSAYQKAYLYMLPVTLLRRKTF